MITLCPDQIWRILAHSHLSLLGAPKNGPVKFVESSITQLCIDRVCSNLVIWCTIDLQTQEMVRIHFRSNPKWWMAAELQTFKSL